METVHDSGSQKPLRLTHWSLSMGILQTLMGLHMKKNIFSSKVLILHTVGKLIEN